MNQLIEFFLEKGYLVSPSLLRCLPKDFSSEEFFKVFEKHIKAKNEIIVLNEDVYESIFKENCIFDFNWSEFDNARVLKEKGKDEKIYSTFLDIIYYNEKKDKLNKILTDIKKPEVESNVREEKDKEYNLIVLNSYLEGSQKRDVKDFVSYFKVRYIMLRNILQDRQELQNVLSINKIKNKKNDELVSLIGLVSGKRVTKNGNIILIVEDLTGTINVLVNKNRYDLYNKGRDVCLDETIGVIGIFRNNFIFVNDIIFPDIPLIKELKKTKEEIYVAFISDTHIGSKVFLKDKFEKFLKWIMGENGNDEQKDIAAKVKYLFITGDLVDGVGNYQGQENDLEIKDIYEQYKVFIELIKRIPSNIKIIISPGNHDALRLAEPQPAIDRSYIEELYNMDNVFLVSNPARVNICSDINFNGLDILIYHGMSFNYYADNVESIRKEGGVLRADLLMKYLLQKRHLAPTHTATSYIPNEQEDVLVIDKVPDIFVSGHIHRCSVINYKGVTLINSSCWIGQTDFQEKVGLVPEPGRVVLLNLNNRGVKIFNFCEDDKDK